jgi:hypothetical protein
MNGKFMMTLLIIALIVISPLPAFASTTTIEATGEYIMGDNDTVIEAKKLALQDAKRLALERVGTYVESTTEVKENTVTRDEIRQYSAGIVKIQEINEERKLLENKATLIRVHVSATVDPGVLVKQLLALRDRKDVEEKAKKLSVENEMLRKDIEQLNAQLKGVTSGRQHQQLRLKREAALDKILENDKGLTMLVSGEHLVKASLLERQKKQDDRQLVKRFLKEVAAAYQIDSREPEVEDNGDGTSNISIHYSIQLPGRYSLNDSLIAVPCSNEFMARGFRILAFSNGGLLFKCGDSSNRKCDRMLTYFSEEVRRFRIVIKVGKRTLKEAVAVSSVVTDKTRIDRRGRIYRVPVRYNPKLSDSTFEYYPLVKNASYISKFANVPHEELRNVSTIQIHIVYD